jgi:hypothetical protein
MSAYFRHGETFFDKPVKILYPLFGRFERRNSLFRWLIVEMSTNVGISLPFDRVDTGRFAEMYTKLGMFAPITRSFGRRIRGDTMNGLSVTIIYY